MWVSRIPSRIPKRNLFTHIPIPHKDNIKKEYNRFFISMSKVIILSSILWGFESYNEKKKYIQQCQYAVDNIFYECLRKNKSLNKIDCHNLKKVFQDSLNYY